MENCDTEVKVQKLIEVTLIFCLSPFFLMEIWGFTATMSAMPEM